MHARGWAHYDIKPANVLIFEEGGFDIGKLCDLGAARQFHLDTDLADTGGRLLCVLSNPRRQPCSCSIVTRSVAPDTACRLQGMKAPCMHGLYNTSVQQVTVHTRVMPF